MCNIDVEGLWIIDNKAEYFPRGLPTIFPILINLQLENCRLKEISSKDFEGLDNLMVLDLNQFEIKSLPNDFFVETPKLQFIYFNNNKIERLSSKILDPLNKKNLKQFWLGENSSISVYFAKGGGTTLEALMKKIDAKCLPPRWKTFY